MRKIYLTQGKVALVDDLDYVWLNQYKWFYEKPGSYACRRKGYRSIRMHRLILDAPEALDVDHIDGDGLNNQRSNLRICFHKENIRNAKIRKDNTSGFKGVSWNKHAKAWHARVFLDGKAKSLGYHKELRDAANAYNEGAIKYFGEFAKLNKFT